MSENGRGVIVLGMHRAGTSILAHLLVALGFEVPGELVASDEGNPAGYWEPRDIVEIHNQFLYSVGRTWSDPSPMSDEFAGEAADNARRDLRSLFGDTVATHSRWVIKDPRMCRLLPLWDEILAENADTIRFLTVLRSPLSVADSLAARDGFGRSKGLLLWLHHYIEAEAATRSRHRRQLVFGRFVDLPQSPDVVEALRAVTANPDLTGETVGVALDDVLDRSLIHHGHNDAQYDEVLACHPWVGRAWTSLTSLDTDGEPAARLALDEIRDQILDASQLFGDRAIETAETHGERYPGLRAEIEAFRHVVNTQREEIRAQRDELKVVRHELTVLPDELKVVPDELKVVRDELKVLRDELKVIGDDLKVVPPELTVVRDDLKVIGDELIGVPEELKVVRDDLTVIGDELNAPTDELKMVRDELKVVRDFLAQKLSTVEARHLAVLDKSLDATARIDDELAGTRRQMKASQETIGEQQERIRILQHDLDDVEQAVAEELSSLRVEVEREMTERDLINQEIDRLRGVQKTT